MPSVYDTNEAALRTLTVPQLVALDHRIHKIHAHDLPKAATDHRMGRLLATISRLHIWVVDELRRRGIPHEAGGPPLAADTEKIQTSFGEFVRQANVSSLPAVRISEADAKKLVNGDVSYIILPNTPDGVTLSEGPIPRAVVITGRIAIGTVRILDLQPPTTERVRFGVRTVGSADPWKAAGIAYFPFVSPVRVRFQGNAGGALRPGTFQLENTALEKQRSAVLAFVFDEDDRVLLIKRRFPPVAWSPPGGFLEGAETPIEAARRETTEETGIEMTSAFFARELDDIGGEGLKAIVGRAKAKEPKPSREATEARWVALEDLTGLSPLSPSRGLFRRALSDLQSFEAREETKQLFDVPTRDITPLMLRGLSEFQLTEMDESLHDRFKPFAERGIESEDIVNAHRFVLDEMNRRKLSHTTNDELTDATARLGKDAGREGDPPPADIHTKRVEALHAGFPETIVMCPGFVSITGSMIYAKGDRKPNDVDVVYRIDDPSQLPGGGGTCLKLERVIEQLTGIKAQHIAEPSGPNWTHLPVYDLVLVKRKEARLEIVREDFARFIKELTEELSCQA